MKELLFELTGGSGTTTCVQGKVILVGEAMAGKTTLLRTLNRSGVGQVAARIAGKTSVPLDSRTVGVDVARMRSLPLEEIGQSEGEERISIKSSQVFLIAFDFAGTYS